MHCTILTSEFPPGPGGIGTHAWEIARNLRGSDVAIDVLCPQDYLDHQTITDFDRRQPFTITRLPSTGLFALKIIIKIISLYRAIINNKPDLLLLSGSSSILYGFLLNRLFFSVPFVVIGHGAEFSVPKGVKKQLLIRAVQNAAGVIYVSRFTKNIAERNGFKNSKTVIIHNGADAHTYSTTIDASLLQKKLHLGSRKILLTVGAISERKAQDTVIRALPQVLAKHPETIYLMVGLPHKKEEYRNVAQELGVVNYVRFADFVPAEELPQYFAICDIFILNSRVASDGENEGFGIVLVEAGLCGKPVIGTRGCGIEEVVVDRETGYLVDPDSPEQTATAIISLLDDPEKAGKMGMAGRKRALEYFTWEKCAAQYLEVIRETVCRVSS